MRVAAWSSSDMSTIGRIAYRREGVFFTLKKMHDRPGNGVWQCTARSKYDIYNCLVMAAMRSRCGHYIFMLWFLLLLSIFFFISSPNLSRPRSDVCHTSTHGIALCEFRMQVWVWSVQHAARWKIQDAKNRHLRTIAQICPAISSQLRHVSTTGKKLFKQQYLLQMSS